MRGVLLGLVMVAGCKSATVVDDAGPPCAEGYNVPVEFSAPGLQSFVLQVPNPPPGSMILGAVFDVDGGLIAQVGPVEVDDGGLPALTAEVDVTGPFTFVSQLRCGPEGRWSFLRGAVPHPVYRELTLDHQVARACAMFDPISATRFRCDGVVIDETGAIDPAFEPGVSSVDRGVRWVLTDGGLVREGPTRSAFDVGADVELVATATVAVTENSVTQVLGDGGVRRSVAPVLPIDGGFDLCAVAERDGQVFVGLFGNEPVSSTFDPLVSPNSFRRCTWDFASNQLTACTTTNQALLRFEPDTGQVLVGPGFRLDLTSGVTSVGQDLDRVSQWGPGGAAERAGEWTVFRTWNWFDTSIEPNQRWTGVISASPGHELFVVRGLDGVHASSTTAWRVEPGLTAWARLP